MAEDSPNPRGARPILGGLKGEPIELDAQRVLLAGEKRRGVTNRFPPIDPF